MKKEEDYELLQVIGKNLCGDNEDVNIDISFYISVITVIFLNLLFTYKHLIVYQVDNTD